MKRTKEDNYTIADDVFDKEQETNNEIDYVKKSQTIVCITLIILAFLFLFFIYYIEGTPLKVLDPKTKEACENAKQNPTTIDHILDVFEDNNYDRYSIEKVVYNYVPESSAEPEQIYIYFKEYDSDWEYIKEGTAVPWCFSDELKKEIKETE